MFLGVPINATVFGFVECRHFSFWRPGPFRNEERGGSPVGRLKKERKLTDSQEIILGLLTCASF